MYCIKCGTQNTPDGQFCIRCGAKLVPPVSSPAVPPSGSPTAPPQGVSGAGPAVVPTPGRPLPEPGQAPPADVSELLEDLEFGSVITRREAVETIGQQPESDLRIVTALIATSENDPREEIQLAAAEALRAPAHQAILQRHPDLADHAQRASPRSSLEPQPSPPTGSVPPVAALHSVGAPAAPSAPSSHASSGYAALRGMASLFNLIGWGFVGLGGLGAIGGLIAMADDFLTGAGIVLTTAFFGGLGYVWMRIVAESISVLLDIEANTRRAANVLEQRLLE